MIGGSRRARRVRLLLAMASQLLLAVLCPRTLLAQVDTGGVTGVVSDETGGALPGVTVTVTNLATHVVRTATTNADGRYQIAALQPAAYAVKAELSGFTIVTHDDVTVNIGTTIDVNFTLKVGGVSDTINVSGDAPLLESTKASIGTVINQQQLTNLPSLNRQYLDFALLLPASVDSASITQQGAGFSIGGSRSSEAALLVDGFYNMDEGFDLPKQRYSQDSIQEFQVVSFGGEAEYGRAIGGILNGITKSGGNVFHGSAYDFAQSEKFNANDPASVLRGVAKPDYSRQQWGGTVGGPIKANRTFFFGSYERVKQDYTYDNGITAANGAALGLGPADIGNVPRYYRLNFALAKVDHNISDTDRIAASFALSRWTEFNLSSPTAYGTVSRQYNLAASDLSYLFKWTKVAQDGKSLHELKVSYFPRYYGVTGLPEGGAPLVPDGTINPPGVYQSNASPPAVNITSVASFGSVSLNNHIITYPVEAIYASTKFVGNHTLKYGADYMNAYYDYTLYSSLRGTYTFSSLANYQKGVYSQFTESFGDPHNPRRHQYVSGFLQDSWKAANRLTMNYGLRYDLEIHPKAVTGDRFGWDRTDFGPRFALAYDVTGSGSTMLKMASGIYYDRIFQNITTFYTNIEDHQSLVSATWTPTTPGAPVYPAVFATQPASLPAGVVNTYILPDHFKTPASGQIIGTLEHAFTPGLVVSTSAVYTHQWNVDYLFDTNLSWDGAQWVRPDSRYRQILQYQFDGWANYVGGIFEVRGRAKRLGANGSLTLNRARDVGNNYSSTMNDQRLGIASEYGPNADTPSVRGVASGWYDILPSLQVSGKFSARSGMAVNPVASGVDLIGAGVLGSRTPGFGRNSFRAPAFTQTDLRVSWRVPFARDQKLLLYAEVYNIFNRVNVLSVNNSYGAVNGSPAAVFMTPTAYYPPRQAQFGAHWDF